VRRRRGERKNRERKRERKRKGRRRREEGKLPEGKGEGGDDGTPAAVLVPWLLALRIGVTDLNFKMGMDVSWKGTNLK
jgi:hypothetical protein